jgi:hypothetical protein
MLGWTPSPEILAQRRKSTTEIQFASVCTLSGDANTDVVEFQMSTPDSRQHHHDAIDDCTYSQW